MNLDVTYLCYGQATEVHSVVCAAMEFLTIWYYSFMDSDHNVIVQLSQLRYGRL